MDPIMMRCHKCGWRGKIRDLYLIIYCPDCLCSWPWSVRFEIYFIVKPSLFNLQNFS